MKLKAGSLNTPVSMINPAILMRKESESTINHVKNERSDITQFIYIYKISIYISKGHKETIMKNVMQIC